MCHNLDLFLYKYFVFISPCLYSNIAKYIDRYRTNKKLKIVLSRVDSDWEIGKPNQNINLSTLVFQLFISKDEWNYRNIFTNNYGRNFFNFYKVFYLNTVAYKYSFNS